MVKDEKNYLLLWSSFSSTTVQRWQEINGNKWKRRKQKKRNTLGWKKKKGFKIKWSSIEIAESFSTVSLGKEGTTHVLSRKLRGWNNKGYQRKTFLTIIKYLFLLLILLLFLSVCSWELVHRKGNYLFSFKYFCKFLWYILLLMEGDLLNSALLI